MQSAYRVLHLGYRIGPYGLIVRSGSRVEKIEPGGKFILVDIMHPDDAAAFVAKQNARTRNPTAGTIPPRPLLLTSVNGPASDPSRHCFLQRG